MQQQSIHQELVKLQKELSANPSSKTLSATKNSVMSDFYVNNNEISEVVKQIHLLQN